MIYKILSLTDITKKLKTETASFQFFSCVLEDERDCSVLNPNFILDFCRIKRDN